MGMLFNTDDTIAMLRIVNLAFNQAGLSRIRNDKTTTAPTAQTFTTLGSVVATYTAVAKPLGIDFDAGSGLRSIRWQKWLGYLDSIQAAFDDEIRLELHRKRDQYRNNQQEPHLQPS